MSFLKRVMGIEPTYPAWKAGVLPLNYTRKEFLIRFQKCFEKHNAQSRNRTSDTRIFSPLLYQLSYLGLIICNTDDFTRFFFSCQDKFSKLCQNIQILFMHSQQAIDQAFYRIAFHSSSPLSNITPIRPVSFNQER